MAQTNANLIWKIADVLRGPFQPNQYGNVILPFTILRRLDCILEPTNADFREVIRRNLSLWVQVAELGVLAIRARFHWI